jgi:hypothetical protein
LFTQPVLMLRGMMLRMGLLVPMMRTLQAGTGKEI